MDLIFKKKLEGIIAESCRLKVLYESYFSSDQAIMEHEVIINKEAWLICRQIINLNNSVGVIVTVENPSSEIIIDSNGYSNWPLINIPIPVLKEYTGVLEFVQAFKDNLISWEEIPNQTSLFEKRDNQLLEDKITID